jgi:hypothetical protein
MEWWHWPLLAFPILPNLWSIWHVNTHRFVSPVERLLWLVTCIFVPCLGGLAYVLFGRPRVLKEENP